MENATKTRPGRIQQTFDESQDRCKQSFKDECDINKIVARINKTGIDPFADRVAMMQHLDLTEIPDYQEIQNQIAVMKTYFDSLPSDLRLRFNNDYATFAEYALNHENLTEMAKMGLIEAAPVPPEPFTASAPSGATGVEPSAAEPGETSSAQLPT